MVVALSEEIGAAEDDDTLVVGETALEVEEVGLSNPLLPVTESLMQERPKQIDPFVVYVWLTVLESTGGVTVGLGLEAASEEDADSAGLELGGATEEVRTLLLDTEALPPTDVMLDEVDEAVFRVEDGSESTFVDADEICVESAEFEAELEGEGVDAAAVLLEEGDTLPLTWLDTPEEVEIWLEVPLEVVSLPLAGFAVNEGLGILPVPIVDGDRLLPAWLSVFETVLMLLLETNKLLLVENPVKEMLVMLLMALEDRMLELSGVLMIEELETLPVSAGVD